MRGGPFCTYPNCKALWASGSEPLLNTCSLKYWHIWYACTGFLFLLMTYIQCILCPIARSPPGLASFPGHATKVFLGVWRGLGTTCTSRLVQDCQGLSQDVPRYHMHLYVYIIIFHIVFVVSPAFSPLKEGGASPCIQLHPLYGWGGAVAAPQTGLTLWGRS